MSKFKTPEMKAVRFTEEDVIVASGGGNPREAILTGFYVDNDGPASINYLGTNYSYDNYGELETAIGNAGLSPLFAPTRGDMWSPNDMFDYEGESDYGAGFPNGTYEYSDGAFRFRHQ